MCSTIGLVQKVAKEQFEKVISEEEFRRLQESLPGAEKQDIVSAKTEIDLVEFIQMEMLRTSRCDLDFLADVHATFHACDLDGSGVGDFSE